MRISTKASTIIAAIALVPIVAAPSASAAVLGGQVSDPQGGTANPGQDIRHATVLYDQAGTVSAEVTTQAPALEQLVAGASFIVGTASKRRGTCAGELQQDIFTFGPADGPPSGDLQVGKVKLGDTDATQLGQTISFSTATGTAEAPRGPSVALIAAPWNCAVVTTFGPRTKRGDDYVTDDDSGVFPLTTGPSAGCAIASRIRRHRIQATCTNVSGRVVVRVYRSNKLLKTRKATVRGGRVAVSARGVRRGGSYTAAVWKGSTMYGVGGVRLR